MTAPFPTRCEQCGQVDDHPKMYYAITGKGTETFHHDCMPWTVQRDLTTYGYWGPEGWVDGPDIPDKELGEHAKRVLGIRKKAEGGTRGEKLRTAILKLDEGN